MASDAGVDLGDVDVDLDLAAYAAHQGRTAAEHVAYLATLAGALATINANGELDVGPMPGPQAEVALHFWTGADRVRAASHAAGDRPLRDRQRRVRVGFGPRRP